MSLYVTHQIAARAWYSKSKSLLLYLDFLDLDGDGNGESSTLGLDGEPFGVVSPDISRSLSVR
jgi:hypothetical protein